MSRDAYPTGKLLAILPGDLIPYQISMNSEELIETAKTAIGAGEKDDYSLTLTTHAAALEVKAPVLSKILHGSLSSSS